MEKVFLKKVLITNSNEFEQWEKLAKSIEIKNAKMRSLARNNIYILTKSIFALEKKLKKNKSIDKEKKLDLLKKQRKILIDVYNQCVPENKKINWLKKHN